MMDVLELLDKLDEMTILFDPIYSADEHMIVAYEVIGTIINDDLQVNVRDFSYNEDVPVEIRAEIEQLAIRKALRLAKQEPYPIDLLIPCNPNLLMLDFGESFFSLLNEVYEEENLACLTLMMEEHLFKGDIQQLHHVIRYFKTYGIKIALVNVGDKTKLDHILMLEPSVLKINVSQLNYNLWGAQNHVFATLKTLAVKIGASLLIDQIHTVYELQHSWKNGARYYKGPYLQTPQEHFIPRETLKDRFKQECEQFIVTEKKLLEQKYANIQALQKNILLAVEQTNPTSEHTDRLKQLAEKLEHYAFRLYICDAEGFQITPNVFKGENEWQLQCDALGKNWSWRPYFLMNIIKMSKETHGELSASYSDIETGELIRTFSIALYDNEYLFIDLSYSYLYESNLVN